MRQSRPETVDDPASKMTVASWVVPALAFLTTAVIVVATLPVSATTVGATAVVAIGVMAVPGNSQAAAPPPVDPQSNPGAGVTGMVPADNGSSIQSNSDPGDVDPGTTYVDPGTSTTNTTTTTTTTTSTGGHGDPHGDPNDDPPDEHEPPDD